MFQNLNFLRNIIIYSVILFSQFSFTFASIHELSAPLVPLMSDSVELTKPKQKRGNPSNDRTALSLNKLLETRIKHEYSLEDELTFCRQRKFQSGRTSRLLTRSQSNSDVTKRTENPTKRTRAQSADKSRETTKKIEEVRRSTNRVSKKTIAATTIGTGVAAAGVAVAANLDHDKVCSCLKECEELTDIAELVSETFDYITKYFCGKEFGFCGKVEDCMFDILCCRCECDSCDCGDCVDCCRDCADCCRDCRS
jgi:hypothetical protein